MGAHDFDTGSLDRLLHKLPRVTRVMMAGAVDGTDAYEPIGAPYSLRSGRMQPLPRLEHYPTQHQLAAPCRAGRQQPLPH